MTPTPEHKEECMANAYQDFLSQKDDCYLLNRLADEIGTEALDDLESFLIIKMITSRNYTGKGDPSFQDIRDNI